MKTKFIIGSVAILCLALGIYYFAIPSEKKRWKNINEQVTNFRNFRHGSFADINSQALQMKESINAFQEKYPEWRAEDVKSLAFSIDTLSTVKYIQLAQDKLSYLLTHQASFQAQKDSMQYLMDTLKAGFYIHGNLGLGNQMVEDIEGKMSIAQFNIDWETKISTLDSTIKVLVADSWEMSSLARSKGLLRSAPISDVAIVEKILTAESDSPDQKRYVYRVKATAEATVPPHWYSLSEPVYDLVFDGLVYCEGKANTDIVVGTLDQFRVQYKQKGTKRSL
jgi:hypothetical protein